MYGLDLILTRGSRLGSGRGKPAKIRFESAGRGVTKDCGWFPKGPAPPKKGFHHRTDFLKGKAKSPAAFDLRPVIFSKARSVRGPSQLCRTFFQGAAVPFGNRKQFFPWKPISNLRKTLAPPNPPLWNCSQQVSPKFLEQHHFLKAGRRDLLQQGRVRTPNQEY